MQVSHIFRAILSACTYACMLQECTQNAGVPAVETTHRKQLNGMIIRFPEETLLHSICDATHHNGNNQCWKEANVSRDPAQKSCKYDKHRSTDGECILREFHLCAIDSLISCSSNTWPWLISDERLLGHVTWTNSLWWVLHANLHLIRRNSVLNHLYLWILRWVVLDLEWLHLC